MSRRNLRHCPGIGPDGVKNATENLGLGSRLSVQVAGQEEAFLNFLKTSISRGIREDGLLRSNPGLEFPLEQEQVLLRKTLKKREVVPMLNSLSTTP
jgi:hypothetical protein